MNKLVLKIISFLIFNIIILFFVGCDSTSGKEVIIKNGTSENIKIMKIHYSQNIEIEPAKTITVYINDYSEGYDLEVIWKEETYIGNTGYLQDSQKITIELLENMHCKITTHGKYTGETHYVQLEK